MRTTRIITISALLLSGLLHAQDGALDPTFNPTDLGYGSGGGADTTVYSTAIQADGKIIIGGDFTSYNGVARNYIAMLNVDGSLDTGFNPAGVSGGPYAMVYATAIQADGKIIIGGTITGPGTNFIARLNADGSLDTGFNSGTGPNASIYSIAIQTDGKIIICGSFTSYNGTARDYIARLNADGSLDISFDPGASPNAPVNSVAIQANGKIIIGGVFTICQGILRKRIARLNADGSLDIGFNPGTGADWHVYTVAIQADGKIIIGGDFTSYNGTGRNRIARLNANGSLDTGFDPGTGADNTVGSSTVQADGKIIIGGEFTSYNGAVRSRIARLNADGSLDTGFNAGTGANNYVLSTAVQADGKIIIGGGFTSYNGITRNRIARLNADGSLDTGFNTATGANNAVSSIEIQADGKIIIGGSFTSYNGAVRNRIARLNADGSLDTGFDPGTGASGGVLSVAIQADGKIIIGGAFTSYNGTARNCIARLNADGSLDTGFDPGTGAYGVLSVAIQADGKIIIGGDFTSCNGIARNRIARLNADGSLDTSFDPGTGANNRVYSTAIQADGKIIIGGGYTSYNGTARNRIARLNADGSLDTGFNPGTGANSVVYSTAIQADAKIIIGGGFTSYNGTARNRIARLNVDGSLDTGFNPATGANNAVSSIEIQADGKIIIGGSFTSYNGAVRNRIARLNADGSLDTGFNAGTGANNYVYSTAIQADGKIVIGGAFTSYNGTGRNRLARINGTERAGIRVLLEGPYSGATMTDALRSLPSFPLTEPFTAMGYAETVYVPGAIIAPSVLSVSGNNAIVDWVIVEMRPAATPSVVAASRAVLLQRDGDIVDLDGVSTVGFAGLAHGNYCVAVKPRTHLPVMLSASTPFAYGTSTTAVDFALPATQVHDADARKDAGGVMLLATGDATFNEELSYVGNGNDRDPILLRVGGSTPSNVVSGYWPEDVNMDGVVKYVGANNDRDPILLNVGGSTPTATRNAQLP